MRLSSVVLAILIACSSLGCRLFDDPDAVGLRDVGNNATQHDLGPVDMSADVDVPDTSRPDGPEDLGGPDADMTDADMGDGGMPIEVDPFTLLELIRDEVCAYYARQDYHGTVFFNVGFRDEGGCHSFFDFFLRNLLGVVARDAHFNRARVNADAVRSIIDHVRNYTGDPRVFPITDVDGIVTPLSGIGGPCSSGFACESTLERPATCYLANREDCDGECVETWRVCAGTLCGTNEWCFGGVCVEYRADGSPCSSDVMCENQCLTNVCGTLQLGADCTANPDDCGSGAFCRSDSMPRVCAALGILNDPCSEGAGCDPSHYCDTTAGLCAEIAEGTPCRLGQCTTGLNCVQESSTDAETFCYAPRAVGAYCEQDTHCESGTYCNVNVCTAAKSIGAACRDNRECESICRYPQSDAMTGSCAQFDWGLQADEICHVEAARCGMPLECETAGGTVLSGTCRAPAPLSVGDACEASRPFWCPDGSTCRAGLCETISPTGTPCTDDGECASNFCFMGSCFDRVSACTEGLTP